MAAIGWDAAVYLRTRKEARALLPFPQAFKQCLRPVLVLNSVPRRRT